MPRPRAKRRHGRQGPVDDEAPSQKHEVEQTARTPLLMRSKVKSLAPYPRLYTSMALLRGARQQHGGNRIKSLRSRRGRRKPTPPPGYDAWKDEDEDKAPHESKLGRQPAIVGLVKVKVGRGVHLNEGGGIAGGELGLSVYLWDTVGYMVDCKTHHSKKHAAAEKRDAVVFRDSAVDEAEPLRQSNLQGLQDCRYALLARLGVWDHVRHRGSCVHGRN